MESVDSTSSAMPLTVSFHFDKWRVSLKNRPSGWSGLASISPLGFETRNVEPSSVLIVLSLIPQVSLDIHIAVSVPSDLNLEREPHWSSFTALARTHQQKQNIRSGSIRPILRRPVCGEQIHQPRQSV